MKRMMRFLPAMLILLFLCIHLALINDYGLTWDFHHHFFSGGWFLGMKPEILEPRPLPYIEPDPRLTVKLPYGPFVQIIPTASWLLFYKTLHMLPYDSAYHLPIVIAGVLGIAILLLFIKEAFGKYESMIAAVFLFLTPRYFSDLHNDMKDVPSAAVFCLNMYLIWRLVKYRRVRDLILSAIGFSLAFNTKVNAIFIPIILGTYLALLWLQSAIRRLGNLPKRPGIRDIRRALFFPVSTRTHRIRTFILLSWFPLAALFAFILWSALWGDGVGQIKLMFVTFGVGTNNIEVLLHGTIYRSGVDVPWFYAPWYLAITTPLPILILALTGMGIALKRWLKNGSTPSLLLLLWLAVPLSRYLSPKTGVLDGIRHFEEVVFPIAALAAVGAVRIGTSFVKFPAIPLRVRKMVLWIMSAVVGLSLVIPIVLYHPFQITYFNALVGGSRGAYGLYDLDYWGGSQKYAVEWINSHAPKNAKILIVMAGNVAGTYLRPDLIPNLNKSWIDEADYIVILNRQGFFNRYHIADYIRTHKPVHTITNQGVPLVWIYRNK